MLYSVELRGDLFIEPVAIRTQSVYIRYIAACTSLFSLLFNALYYFAGIFSRYTFFYWRSLYFTFFSFFHLFHPIFPGVFSPTPYPIYNCLFRIKTKVPITYIPPIKKILIGGTIIECSLITPYSFGSLSFPIFFAFVMIFKTRVFLK